METLRPDATELPRETGRPLAPSPGFMTGGIWLLWGGWFDMFGGFSDEKVNVFAIFPLGATIQDGDTGERSDVDIQQCISCTK